MIAAFSGHREILSIDTDKLRLAIRQLYSEGYRIFMSGMAEGFDLLAAEVVLELKEELEDIRLRCVIPFEGHIAKVGAKNRARYQAVCAAADEVVTLADAYHERAYFIRNDYLVDNAEALICYYSGKRRSGTGYTVMRAIKKCLKIVNIYADGVQIEFFG